VRYRLAGLSVLAIASVALSACAAESSGGGGSAGAGSTPNSAPSVTSSAGVTSPPSTASAPTCSPSTMHTHSSGVLTVATDSPAYPPWFIADKPSNGKGYESAVAYAVAKQLGYSASQVKWVVASFTSVIAPTPKQYDFDINEVSITAARAKAVDFSAGYYDVAQAIVALKSSKIANVTTIAGLRGAKLGAQQGTTSYTAITDQIKPSVTPGEFPTNGLAVQALKNGQIAGLVVDLPTGLYLASAELKGAKIVGQLPNIGKPQQFGLVLSKGSSLTSCVSQAVTALRANGTLAKIQQRWLTSAAGAPVLK
jgi:polar amino acid transport system substrate-binding protein